LEIEGRAGNARRSDQVKMTKGLAVSKVRGYWPIAAIETVKIKPEHGLQHVAERLRGKT
jgi:hypothetical protein